MKQILLYLAVLDDNLDIIIVSLRKKFMLEEGDQLVVLKATEGK
ncbi:MULTISPECIES: hypothetical protein [Sediminibacillus]|nr:hypothetical protein [Sediminibacillus terrae]